VEIFWASGVAFLILIVLLGFIRTGKRV
jgi:hypothetical protein